MDSIVLRVLRVLGVVVWIGGVSMVTTVVLPAIRRGDFGPSRLRAFEAIKRRFVWQARMAILVVAVACFAVLGWTTGLTYQQAPPIPDRFVSADGITLMSGGDIVAGKAGFQRADLMDYGSLYGMGSYFGEDYTAANLVRLAL